MDLDVSDISDDLVGLSSDIGMPRLSSVTFVIVVFSRFIRILASQLAVSISLLKADDSFRSSCCRKCRFQNGRYRRKMVNMPAFLSLEFFLAQFEFQLKLFLL
jgi:hypothetical protein